MIAMSRGLLVSSTMEDRSPMEAINRSISSVRLSIFIQIQFAHSVPFFAPINTCDQLIIFFKNESHYKVRLTSEWRKGSDVTLAHHWI